MLKTQATMDVRRTGNKVGIIDIHGEVNSFAENALMDAYTIAGADGTQFIVLNFSGMDYMNSSGIGLLVTLLIRVQRQGQSLLAYGLNEHYKQIFELTRLNEAIRIYGSEAEVFSALEQAA